MTKANQILYKVKSTQYLYKRKLDKALPDEYEYETTENLNKIRNTPSRAGDIRYYEQER